MSPAELFPAKPAAERESELGVVDGKAANAIPKRRVIAEGDSTLDLMLGKTFAVSECVAAEFRAEAFNLTNTPPWGNPNGDFGATAFGSITSAGDPRVFELVLKLRF